MGISRPDMSSPVSHPTGIEAIRASAKLTGHLSRVSVKVFHVGGTDRPELVVRVVWIRLDLFLWLYMFPRDLIASPCSMNFMPCSSFRRLGNNILLKCPSGVLHDLLVHRKSRRPTRSRLSSARRFRLSKVGSCRGWRQRPLDVVFILGIGTGR